MVSAASLQDSSLSSKTRDEISQIKEMSRDLVSALYETVWAVNPEYDNLDALVNYLCQMAGQLCKQAQLQCRLSVSDVPTAIQVSSNVRHNLTMAMKESIHNIVRHSRASEVAIQIAVKCDSISVTIHDNGCGFDFEKCHPGNGLQNMKGRMVNIGGACLVESRPGSGTTVSLHLNLPLHPDHK
jgi:signal transduction histidine kinase